MNEDVAFERLKDLQREMEKSRVMANTLAGLVRNLSARSWWLGRLAMLRAPRPRPAAVRQACEKSASPEAA